MTSIILKSSDGIPFPISLSIAEQMLTVKNFLFDVDFQSDEIIVPINKINSKTLDKIISFCQHHINDPPFVREPVCDSHMSQEEIQEYQNQLCLDNIDDWDLIKE